MNWIEAAGYLASALVLATFCMKTMIPLRCAAVCSNVAFIVYGFYDIVYPVLVLHAILLPLNVWRGVQMLRLIKRVEAASKGDLSTDWLTPFMKEAHLKAGEIIFNRGDHANRLYMIITGDVHLEQIDHTLRAGDLFGEIGLFSADHRRTQTARARPDQAVQPPTTGVPERPARRRSVPSWRSKHVEMIVLPEIGEIRER